jgi:gluconokinase
MLFAGIDIGTGSVKAITVSGNGTVLADFSRPCNTSHPQPGYAEQDAKEILDAVLEILKELAAHMADEKIKAIGFSAAMHGLLAVDDAGQALTPLLLWSDIRSIDQCKGIKKNPLAATLYQDTGTPIHPMSPLCKLAWLREQRPDIFQQACKFISIKEYIFYHLFNEFVVDHSIASATGLFETRNRKWDPNALQLAGIDASKLSSPVTVTKKFFLKKEIAAITGMSSETIFVIGASDGALANLGSGAMDQKNLAVTIGTSAAVRMVVPSPIEDKSKTLFNYILDNNRYISGGASNNGGGLIKKLSSIMGENEKTFGAFLQEAFSAPVGCDEMVFLPYLTGERAPVWNAEATGILSGIQFRHEKNYLMRALIEGITMNLYAIAEKLFAVHKPDTLIASGGFIHSDKWVQMLSDIFLLPVIVNTTADASCMGAAMIAADSVNGSENNYEWQAGVSPEKKFYPSEKDHAVYRKNYETFRKLLHKQEPTSSSSY